MKYFLAIDKGQMYTNKERYKKIECASINIKLDTENNLKALESLTTSFEHEAHLKTFLKEQKLLSTKDYSYDIVIIYKDKFYHSLVVPYSQDKEFLNLRNIEDAIYEYARKKEFLANVISNYISYNYVRQEIYSLKSYLQNPYADYKLYDVIRSFVTKICYGGKDNIDLQNLHTLGILVSRLVGQGSEEKTVREAGAVEPLQDDAVTHHKEELEERYARSRELQVRLF